MKNDEGLARSINRLGRMTDQSSRFAPLRITVPAVLIESELAIAVRRCGVWAVAKKIISQEWWTLRLWRNQ